MPAPRKTRPFSWKTRQTNTVTRTRSSPLGCGHWRGACDISRLIGQAFVSVSPETAGFRALADAQIRKALAGINPAVPVQLKLDRNALGQFLSAAQKQALIKTHLDNTQAYEAILALKARMQELADRLATIRIEADDTQAEATVARLKVSLAALAKTVSKIRVGADTSGITEANVKLLALENTIGKLGPVTQTGDVALGAFTRAITGMGGGWGILTGRITLFGGVLNRVLPQLLTGVTVWHAAADAIIEIGAVVIPASVALAAFGVAGSDAAKKIATQMQNVHTIMDATGQAVAPMTNALEKLHDAVEPQVYQIFGDALNIMNSRAGTFTTLAKGAATVVDQLAARFTAAVTSGSSMSGFLKNAVPDLAKLGDTIGNIGGIFGNIFSVIPGIATKLLTMVDVLSKVAEAATRVAEPVIRVGLAIHGYLLWSGLAVTASLALAGAIANLAVAMVTFAGGALVAGIGALLNFGAAVGGIIANLVALGIEMIQVAGDEGILAGAMVAVDAAMDANPILTVTAALAALGAAVGAAVFFLKGGPSALQKWSDGLVKTAQSAPVMQSLTANLSAQAQVGTKLSAAQAKLNATAKDGITGYTRFGTAVQGVTQAYRDQQGVVNVLSTTKQKLAAAYANETANLAPLAAKYGGTTAALGLLAQAGITTAQVQSGPLSSAWQQALVQIQGTIAGYQAMGVQTGQVGHDLQILGAQSTDTYKAIQQLNQGIDTFISNVIASPQSLNTMEQGFATLAADTGNFTLHLGQLKLAGTNTAVAIDSLTNSNGKLNLSAVNLSQAFFDQVTNINKWADTLRQAGLSQAEVTDAVKAAIGPLLDTASGSTTATAALQALAFTAGGPASGGIKALRDWVGKLGGNQSLLQIATDDATVAMLHQTTQARDLTTAIATELTTAMAQAVFTANGGQAVFTSFALAVQRTGANSIETQAAAVALGKALFATTGNAKSAHDTFYAFAMNALHLTQFQADQLWQDLRGPGAAALAGAGQNVSNLKNNHFDPLKQSIFDVTTNARNLRTSLLNLPANTPVGVTLKASGSGTITYSESITGQTTAMIGSLKFVAAGGMISGGTPGKDSVLGMLMPGEVVVPAAAVKAGAVDHLRGKLPGFAAGGWVGQQHDIANVLPFAVNTEARFAKAVESSFANAANSAVKSALTNAAAKANATYASGPGGGAPAANAALARQLMPNWSTGAEWAAWNSVAMAESGWNQYARNPSSGAYGIPQALPPSKMGAAANPPQSNPAAQIRWMISYIESVYGDPIRAWAHEQSFHWYGLGGLVPGFASGGKPGHFLPSHLVSPEAIAGSAAAAGLQKAEQRDYTGLRDAFIHGPKKYLTKLTADELGTLAKRQAAEQLAYSRLATAVRNEAALRKRTGATAAQIAAAHQLSAHDLGLFATSARQESSTALDQMLNRLPGGHPGWASGLRGQLASLAAIGLPAVSIPVPPVPVPPPVPPPGSGGDGSGSGPPARTAADACATLMQYISLAGPLLPGAAGPGAAGPFPYNSYDNGGYLPPGMSLSWNGTGRPEPVTTGSALEETNMLLRQLIAVTQGSAHATGAQLGRTLNSTARSAAAGGQYRVRGIPLR